MASSSDNDAVMSGTDDKGKQETSSAMETTPTPSGSDATSETDKNTEHNKITPTSSGSEGTSETDKNTEQEQITPTPSGSKSTTDENKQSEHDTLQGLEITDSRVLSSSESKSGPNEDQKKQQETPLAANSSAVDPSRSDSATNTDKKDKGKNPQLDDLGEGGSPSSGVGGVQPKDEIWSTTQFLPFQGDFKLFDLLTSRSEAEAYMEFVKEVHQESKDVSLDAESIHDILNRYVCDQNGEKVQHGPLYYWAVKLVEGLPFRAFFENYDVQRVADRLASVTDKKAWEEILQMNADILSCPQRRGELGQQYSDSKEESEPFDLSKLDLTMAGKYPHILEGHAKMVNDLRQLFKHCREHGVLPTVDGKEHPERQKRVQLIQSIDEKWRTLIKQPNQKLNLPETLGLLPASVLVDWYCKDSHELAEIEKVYTLWLQHQFPAGFLRKNPETLPSYEGEYPIKDFLLAYKAVLYGVDPYTAGELSEGDRQSYKERLYPPDLKAKFIELIYPPNACYANRKIVAGREFSNTLTFQKKEITKYTTVVASYGISTDDFKPGRIYHGNRIVAVQRGELSQQQEGGRLFMVEINPTKRIFSMLTQNQIGGKRIYNLCKNLPNVVGIFQDEKNLPKREPFNDFRFGVSHIAIRRTINSPARSQPLSFLITYSFEFSGGPRVYHGISRANFIKLTNKQITDIYINGCVTPQGETFKPNLGAKLIEDYPGLQIGDLVKHSNTLANRMSNLQIDSHSTSQSVQPVITNTSRRLEGGPLQLNKGKQESGPSGRQLSMQRAHAVPVTLGANKGIQPTVI